MAMAIKASAGVALPFLVWVWATRLPGTRVTQLLRAGAGSMVIFATIFSGVTLASGVGLGWVPALDAPSLIVNWMSLPTAGGELAHALVALFTPVGDQPFIMVSRLLGSAVFLAIFARQWWLTRPGVPAQTVRGAARTLLWAALLAPATLPWYLSWALVLGAVGPWPRRKLAWVVAGSTWLVVCTYPTGESAFTSWQYQLGMVAVSLVAGISLLRPDPLRLRGRIPVVGPELTATR
jgi:alpha-1,6-mannosyltransferase